MSEKLLEVIKELKSISKAKEKSVKFFVNIWIKKVCYATNFFNPNVNW